MLLIEALLESEVSSDYPDHVVTSSSVRPAGSGRRLVRRRAQPTLDKAVAVAFEGVPVELHQPLLAWADARRAEFETRQALSTAMTAFLIFVQHECAAVASSQAAPPAAAARRV